MPEIDGKEVLDPTPVAIPAGMGKPESLVDTIRRLVRNEISHEAQSQGIESFEEANDFDVEDEDWTSPYELSPMQEEYLSSEVDRLEQSGKLKVQQSEDTKDGDEDSKRSGSGSDRERVKPADRDDSETDQS